MGRVGERAWPGNGPGKQGDEMMVPEKDAIIAEMNTYAMRCCVDISGRSRIDVMLCCVGVGSLMDVVVMLCYVDSIDIHVYPTQH